MEQPVPPAQPPKKSGAPPEGQQHTQLSSLQTRRAQGRKGYRQGVPAPTSSARPGSRQASGRGALTRPVLLLPRGVDMQMPPSPDVSPQCLRWPPSPDSIGEAQHPPSST